MAKSAVYGIKSVTLAPVGTNGAYPTAWTGAGCFSFKAIVKDSLSFNDSAAGTNDIEVEDSDQPYASLVSSLASRGFTLDTYDLSAEAYKALQGFTEATETGDSNKGYFVEPETIPDLIKAVQIVTNAFDDMPSKTFEWAKMKIQVTKAGTIGKSGFPNFHLEFKQQQNTDASGKAISGHRWKITA